jgi:hypothetical protein
MILKQSAQKSTSLLVKDLDFASEESQNPKKKVKKRNDYLRLISLARPEWLLLTIGTSKFKFQNH